MKALGVKSLALALGVSTQGLGLGLDSKPWLYTQGLGLSAQVLALTFDEQFVVVLGSLVYKHTFTNDNLRLRNRIFILLLSIGGLHRPSGLLALLGSRARPAKLSFKLGGVGPG